MANDTVWSAAAIKLLKGPVYKSKEKNELWKSLAFHIKQLDDYFLVIGLKVFLDEENGYAFLEQIDDNLARGMEEEKDESSSVQSSVVQLPKLIKKSPLSYDVSMLCVLLRYELEKFENSQTESEVLILRKSEIYSLYKSFIKEKADELKQIKDLDRALRTLCNLTFLFTKDKLDQSEISDDTEFEVSTIIKAKIDIDFMKELLSKMKEETK